MSLSKLMLCFSLEQLLSGLAHEVVMTLVLEGDELVLSGRMEVVTGLMGGLIIKFTFVAAMHSVLITLASFASSGSFMRSGDGLSPISQYVFIGPLPCSDGSLSELINHLTNNHFNIWCCKVNVLTFVPLSQAPLSILK